VKVGPPGEQPGQLSVKCLLPEETALRAVGGGTVDGKAYPPAPGDAKAGRWRIEADSKAASGAHTFLFVLSTGPQAPSVTVERDGGLVGADVDGTKVLFRTDGGPGGRVNNRPLPTRVTPPVK